MSKKKTLLKENTIRRFMKLAEISPLTENYFENYGGINEEEEDEDPLADTGAEDAFGAGMEVGAEDEDVQADMAADEPELSPEDPATEASVETLVTAIMDTVTDVTGVPTSVEGDEGGEEVEMDLDAPPEGGGEVEMDLDAPPEGEPEGEPEDMLGEMLSDANIDLVDNSALVQEITKRVAKRLIRAKLTSKR